MKIIKCKNCGSTNMELTPRYYECNYCHTKYKLSAYLDTNISKEEEQKVDTIWSKYKYIISLLPFVLLIGGYLSSTKEAPTTPFVSQTSPLVINNANTQIGTQSIVINNYVVQDSKPQLELEPKKIEKREIAPIVMKPKKYYRRDTITDMGCSFGNITFPNDMLVYAGGAYGGEETDSQIDQSGHDATKFDVTVNSPTHPVALILGAYEPSLWNISWTKGTKIKAVMVTGYHLQKLNGLDKNIPIINSTYHNRGGCGYLYISNKNLTRLNPLSNRLYEKNIKKVVYAKKGKILFGEQSNRESKLYSVKDKKSKVLKSYTKPLVGKQGLFDLVSKGMLRGATEVDTDKWALQKERLYKKMLKENDSELPEVINGSSTSRFRPRHLHNAYVILKPITIPSGLYGGNLATFFLEKGVPFPKGKLGHSTLYDFNTMSCYGVGCRR